jgi:hypothetical protein
VREGGWEGAINPLVHTLIISHLSERRYIHIAQLCVCARVCACLNVRPHVCMLSSLICATHTMQLRKMFCRWRRSQTSTVIHVNALSADTP